MKGSKLYSINPALNKWEEENYKRLMAKKIKSAKSTLVANAGLRRKDNEKRLSSSRSSSRAARNIAAEQQPQGPAHTSEVLSKLQELLQLSILQQPHQQAVSASAVPATSVQAVLVTGQMVDASQPSNIHSAASSSGGSLQGMQQRTAEADVQASAFRDSMQSMAVTPPLPTAKSPEPHHRQARSGLYCVNRVMAAQKPAVASGSSASVSSSVAALLPEDLICIAQAATALLQGQPNRPKIVATRGSSNAAGVQSGTNGSRRPGFGNAKGKQQQRKRQATAVIKQKPAWSDDYSSTAAVAPSAAATAGTAIARPDSRLPRCQQSSWQQQQQQVQRGQQGTSPIKAGKPVSDAVARVRRAPAAAADTVVGEGQPSGSSGSTAACRTKCRSAGSAQQGSPVKAAARTGRAASAAGRLTATASTSDGGLADSSDAVFRVKLLPANVLQQLSWQQRGDAATTAAAAGSAKVATGVGTGGSPSHPPPNAVFGSSAASLSCGMARLCSTAAATRYSNTYANGSLTNRISGGKHGQQHPETTGPAGAAGPALADGAAAAGCIAEGSIVGAVAAGQSRLGSAIGTARAMSPMDVLTSSLMTLNSLVHNKLKALEAQQQPQQHELEAAGGGQQQQGGSTHVALGQQQWRRPLQQIQVARWSNGSSSELMGCDVQLQPSELLLGGVDALGISELAFLERGQVPMAAAAAAATAAAPIAAEALTEALADAQTSDQGLGLASGGTTAARPYGGGRGLQKLHLIGRESADPAADRQQRAAYGYCAEDDDNVLIGTLHSFTGALLTASERSYVSRTQASSRSQTQTEYGCAGAAHAAPVNSSRCQPCPGALNIEQHTSNQQFQVCVYGCLENEGTEDEYGDDWERECENAEAGEQQEGIWEQSLELQHQARQLADSLQQLQLLMQSESQVM